MLTNTTCISNLIKGFKATCNATKAVTQPTIDLIDDGVILLNAFTGNVTHDCSKDEYSICAIKIINQVFQSKEIENDRNIINNHPKIINEIIKFEGKELDRHSSQLHAWYRIWKEPM